MNTPEGGVSVAPLERRELDLHGHRLVYHVGGSGPALLLVHGITSTAATWSAVAGRLARAHTVIAPDLPGHGESDKPPGDYSLGAYAATLRDLLNQLDIARATIVGHSLGGGIAMQAAYLFPERVARLALVSSGGLGVDVHRLLRAATLPGSELVLPMLSAGPVLRTGDRMIRRLHRLGLRLPADVEEFWSGLQSLSEPEARQAFVATARAVIGPSGQRVSALNRLYLTELLPTLLIWGARDRIIPATHGRAAAGSMADCRFEVFERSGHFPQKEEPRRFAQVLLQFIAATDPADLSPDVAVTPASGAGIDGS